MFGIPRKFLVFTLIAVGAFSASAQPAIQPAADITKVPAAAQPSPHFDADAATEAYMAMMPPAAVARSNAYFEGGYWLILWDFLYGTAISLVLLNLRWSARMRDLAVRVTRFRWLQPLLYWVEYSSLSRVLGFPLEFYENYVREHKYGLATQTFGPWMGDEFKSLLVSLVIASIADVDPVCHRAQISKYLVDMGRGRVDGADDDPDRYRAGVSATYLQHAQETRRPQDHGADSAHGARQRHSHQRCVAD